jgi:hypothetical protein
METFLSMRSVLLKDFAPFVQGCTERLKAASLRYAEKQGRPTQYLESGETDKEAIARAIARQDGIQKGLVAVLTCVEPCRTFDVYRDRVSRQLKLVSRKRKCLHLYHYFVHPTFGFMNARIQTWFPFNIQICLNGREWLARQMDQTGIVYERRDNCFPWIVDVDRAQRLLARQVEVAWPSKLDAIAQRLNPARAAIFGDWETRYYWSAFQTEWATDVMFRDPAVLAPIYQALVLHGITSFHSQDVMRFLGKKLYPWFRGEVRSDFKGRPEGVRIKHTVGVNSVKLYDKAGSILRAETTLNNPYDLKVFRSKEGDPDGPRTWRKLRRGIADLHRWTQVSQACNDRYLEALAAVDTAAPLGTLIAPICRPTQWRGKRSRGLRPWDSTDLALLAAINRGEFVLRGFRNRDLLSILTPVVPSDPAQRRRQTARITRLLRLLRAHGLIRKLGTSYRYVATRKAQHIIPALLAAQRATAEQLRKIA